MKLAVVGDIHTFWSDFDRHYFDTSDYDALLFVGDLPNRRLWQAPKLAQTLARLSKPSYFLPGNHDALSLVQLAGEFLQHRSLIVAGAVGQSRRVSVLREALRPIVYCGFDWHALRTDERVVALLAGRPHSMGGPLTAAPYLRAAFGVGNLEESARRLERVIDRIPHRELIILAHNGPSGLGAAPTSPWGCDFKRGGGDWGDPDLAHAVSYAKGQGKRVLAVVAGHMHYPTKTNARMRDWCVSCDDTLYVNAARVPRIRREGTRSCHHHLSLEFNGDGVNLCEVWTYPGGEDRFTVNATVLDRAE